MLFLTHSRVNQNQFSRVDLGAASLALSAAVLSGSMGGCAFVTKENPERSELLGTHPIPVADWPARYPVITETLSGSGKDLDQTVKIGALTPALISWVTEHHAVNFSEIAVTNSNIPGLLTRYTPEQKNEADWQAGYVFRSCFAKLACPSPCPENDLDCTTYTTNCFIFEPKTAPIGTILFLNGMMGARQEHERQFVRTLTQQGWQVIAVEPPGLGPDPETTALNKIYDGKVELAEERSKITGKENTDLPDSIGEFFATYADAYLAERAYISEAVIKDLKTRGEFLGENRFAVIGSSLGAINLPVVAARLRTSTRIDCAVLIVGGGDLINVIEHCCLDGKFVKLPKAVTEDPKKMVKLEASYLEHSKLDPIKCAPQLEGIPVLNIHAMFDQVVSSPTGTALWHALKEPESWDYPTGHYGMYFILPLITNEVHAWVAAQNYRALNQLAKR